MPEMKELAREIAVTRNKLRAAEDAILAEWNKRYDAKSEPKK